jgi:hypothetical protein
MDLLITVLTLLAAVLAITPRERQLDIRVRIRTFDRSVVFFGIFAVLSLEFYEFLQRHLSWLPPKECWPQGLTPKNATYLVILVVAATLWIRLRFAKLTRSKMSTFRELIEELYWNGNYGELFALLHTHLKSLFRIYSSDYFLPRLRERLSPISSIRSTAFLVDELAKAKGAPPLTQANNSTGRRYYRRIRSSISHTAWRVLRLLPVDDTSQDSSRELIRGVFLAPKFLTALAQTRPYLGLEIIELSTQSFERAEFVDLFVRELLRDHHSVFYREIQNNQNTWRERYQLPESNRFLYFFLKDVSIAKKLNIYKPIGDSMLSYLDDLTRHPLGDAYNRTVDRDFEDVESWHSPLFVGVQFFDIMVKEALFQKMEWHMWLYYMPLVIERIVRNYRLTDPLVEPEYEFPTRYGYILYRAFSSMRDWILAVEHIPSDQANVKLTSTSVSYDENSNIPKSSIIAMTRCLYYVLQSKHIGHRTKRSLAAMVFDIYFDLRASGNFDSYAQVLLSAILGVKSYEKSQHEYRKTLTELFEAEKDEYLIKRSEVHVAEVEAAINLGT